MWWDTDSAVPRTAAHEVEVTPPLSEVLQVDTAENYLAVTVPATATHVRYRYRNPGAGQSDVTKQLATLLVPGEIQITIRARTDNTKQQDFFIRVNRAAARSDNSLATLSAVGGELSPVLNDAPPTSRDFTIIVPFTRTRTTLTATATDPLATLAFSANVNANNDRVNLTELQTVVTITVTAEDDSVAVYTLTIIRQDAATDSTLSALSFDAGELSPAFARTVTAYTARVPYATATTNITATAGSDLATRVITSDRDASVADGNVDLLPGDNIITITVTAESGEARVYTITITRTPAATDSTLSALSFSDIELSPAFAPTEQNYSATVAYVFTDTTITATANNALAKSVTVTSNRDDNVDDGINLSVGNNVITVTVTAESDATTTYTITITRSAISRDTTLSALSLFGISLSPTFDPATRSYTADVAYTVTATAITVTRNSALAKRAVIASAQDSDILVNVIDLAVGANVITVTVTAQDDSVGVYTITVIRAAPSDDTTLAALSLSGITLSPAFVSTTRNYTATVDYVFTQTTLTATAADPLSKGFTITAADVTNNLVRLSVGENVIAVTVTAQNDMTGSYTITINRRAASTDTTLSALSLSGINLSPAFVATTRSYSATVDYVFTTTTIAATATDSLAQTPLITSDKDNDIRNGIIDLAVGANIITVTVTAEGSVGVYTVMVTRTPASTDTRLSALSFDGVTLSPAFASSTRSYMATVDFVFTQTTITATANDPLANNLVR